MASTYRLLSNQPKSVSGQNMSRIIKFRAWDKEQNQMYDDSCGFGAISVLKEAEEFDLPLMQFTGLLDRNGKEIYEGDIVRGIDNEDEGCGWSSKAKVKGVVEYNIQWGYRFQLKDHTQRILDLYSLQQNTFQVIGNIYENPELLT